MFDLLDTVDRDLRRFCRDLDPGVVAAADAQAAIKTLARCERLAAGARVRLTSCLEGDEQAKTDWLAQNTNQTPGDAAKDLETSQQLAGLGATDEALCNGELTPAQAHEVSSAAAEDPDAESDLLDTARNGSVPELRRAAKQVRAAATDDDQKARRAHENRDLSSGVDEETGEGWIHTKGPTSSIAEMLALLEPWIQAEFDRARRQGRHERRGAYAFDALLAALRFAAACRAGSAGGAAVGPPVNILVRADLTAILRGHTIAGETCEIDGLGPIPVQALLELLPPAAIDLICTNGLDVFNITHFGRRANARQQVVLDWLGGQCARLGCPATRHLQVDHRIDWATIHITELRNLDWLCPQDHHRKTHQRWALVNGTGRRPMVPPDDPAHPSRTGDPPRHQAA